MVLLATSQHCPCVVAAPVDPPAAGDMLDCATAIETPPVSNAAAANAVSFVNVMAYTSLDRWQNCQPGLTESATERSKRMHRR
jgi:hypothetical protein